MELRVAMLSSPGGRTVNEDACAHWTDDRSVCCVLCDGAGGHGGGDVAAGVAVQVALASYAADPSCSPQRLEAIFGEVQARIRDSQKVGGRQADMRTTLVLLALDLGARTACWGHVGDSRLYWFRNGWRLAQTRDHSVAQSLIDAGTSRSKDPRDLPGRNALLSSLGSAHDLRVDLLEAPFSIEEGDAALLCSDGFWEDVPEREMESALQRATSPEEWLLMMERVLLRTPRPSRDNYSAFAVWLGRFDPTTVETTR